MVAPSWQAQGSDPLGTAVAQALAEEKLVGATWALVVADRTTVGAAGFNDMRQRTPMAAEDRVQVASVTKTLLATGVLRLVTEGRVRLDAPVSSYLPDVAIENPWSDTAPLRVRHLLDHTGGLDDARMWQVFSLRADPDAPLRAGLARDGRAVPVRHPPGERFSYSNTGYLLLGMLIESVTGERYETWLGRELLAPLGMARSSFGFVTQAGAQRDPGLAMGHFDPETASASVPSFVRPATQFTTTAADMAQFARFLMGDGRVGGRTLVDGALLRAMAVPTTTEAARAGLAAGYALGLLRRDRHGRVGRCHVGNQGNFRAVLCLFPEHGRAFFAAFNTDPEDANFGRVEGMLVEALGVPETPEQAAQAPAVDPAAWEGYYRQRPVRFAQFGYVDELTGITRLEWTGAALSLKALGGRERDLVPVGGALFRTQDRREATHVLMVSADGRRLVGDGLRTLEQVAPISVYAHWASAAAGVAALLYLLLAGAIRSVRAIRRGAWHAEPLRWPAACLALMLVAPSLFLAQSYLELGDPTPANLAVAALTAALPLALLLAGAQLIRTGLQARIARIDLVVLVAALQWTAVLASWGMLPLQLWR